MCVVTYLVSWGLHGCCGIPGILGRRRRPHHTNHLRHRCLAGDVLPGRLPQVLVILCHKTGKIEGDPREDALPVHRDIVWFKVGHLDGEGLMEDVWDSRKETDGQGHLTVGFDETL